jgi:aspartyl-tRNA(Asn)/glutamyl-tRNA(Gln) amidotransferase subunit A
MGIHTRFPDWSSLSESDRPGALELSRERLGRVGRALHAVVGEVPGPYKPDGALARMPYVAKDMFATGHSRPTWGCGQAMAAATPRAAVVDLLDRAGACLIGTAEMTELAYEPSGINVVRGRVLNPWNAEFVPGGSSSGSAALVAAGCCHAALGSDTGGSIRIPAHCCGITGLKPTWGKLPVDGAMSLAPNLDTVGILARGAIDAAMVWSALSGEPPLEMPKGLSGAVLEDTFQDSDPEIAEICRVALEVLRRSGLRIDARPGFPEEADRQCLIVMQGEAARTHATRMGDERIDATLRKRLRKGFAIGDEELARSLAVRAGLRAETLAALFGAAAVLLLPVMPIRTPRVTEVDPSSPGFTPRTLYALSRFTRFANYLGLPALTVPVGFDSRGMPVGLQIVGRPDSDAMLLAIGARLQAETDWHRRVPAGIAADIGAE